MPRELKKVLIGDNVLWQGYIEAKVTAVATDRFSDQTHIRIEYKRWLLGTVTTWVRDFELAYVTKEESDGRR